jgi:hypothetical protein
MKRYYITVIGYHRNSDTTHQTTIDCDGMNYSSAGCYEFFIKEEDNYEPIAYYPIRHTIITKIEELY